MPGFDQNNLDKVYYTGNQLAYHGLQDNPVQVVKQKAKLFMILQFKEAIIQRCNNLSELARPDGETTEEREKVQQIVAFRGIEG